MPTLDRLAPLALALALGCASTTPRPIDPSELPEGPGVRPALSAEAAPAPVPLPRWALPRPYRGRPSRPSSAGASGVF